MYEIHDPDTNISKASCPQGRSQSRPEHSASIYSHPRMTLGIRNRLAELRERLVNDKDKGIPAILSVMSLVRELDHEPFPGFTEGLTAEFEFIQRELGVLDPNQPSQAKQFAAIGKRLDFLSRILSFVVECWVSTTETKPSAAFPSDSGAKP